jgi:ubiquinone/menaquinone biosynthesis C-methylase UbiE
MDVLRMDEIKSSLKRAEFPRSGAYDEDWMIENQMGPNALWLVEWLCEVLPLEPGMRVLDLGCGKAMTSIFLAREFGVRVWAADLWMSPDGNWQRIVASGTADLVCPLKAEAHALPFAQGFFDAAISVDAYQYFGTDALYLDYLSRFIRPAGLLGVVVPGLMQPIGSTPPEHLVRPQANGKVFWESDCRCFKTADFWQELWQNCPTVTQMAVAAQPDGWRHWRDFERALEATGKNLFPSDAETLEKDHGRFIGLLRLTAKRTKGTGENLYDPGLGALVGVDSTEQRTESAP